MRTKELATLLKYYELIAELYGLPSQVVETLSLQVRDAAYGNQSQTRACAAIIDGIQAREPGQALWAEARRRLLGLAA